MLDSGGQDDFLETWFGRERYKQAGVYNIA